LHKGILAIWFSVVLGDTLEETVQLLAQCVILLVHPLVVFVVECPGRF